MFSDFHICQFQLNQQHSYRSKTLLQFQTVKNLMNFNTDKKSQKSKFKIAHSLEELEDQLILTLKDQPLLKNNQQVNDDEDYFQNQELQTLNRMKHNAQLRKKVKELSDVTASHLQAKQQGSGGILPHYDDHSFKNQQIQVQGNGIIKNRKPKGFKNTQNDFLTKQQTTAQTLGSEYNPIKIKKHMRNNKQSNAADLLNFLNQTAQDNIADENAKRDASQAIDSALDSIRKKRITELTAKRQVESVDISSILGFNEQQQLLNKSILNAQKKKNQEKRNFILEVIKEEHDSQNQGKQAKQTQKQSEVVIELNPISYTGQDRKYVRKDFDINGIKSGTTSAMFVKLPSERLVKKQQKDNLPESFKDFTPEQLQKMRQQVSFLEDKQLGTGLAGTLKFLRENSLLGYEEQVGRTTDKNGSYSNDPNDRVKLEYRNANGQIMKPKQAFRYLCATFHGEGAGKNKIQKRKKKELMEMRMKEKVNTDGQLLNLLNQHQRKTNEAYMVIDIGKKATSKDQ